MKIPNLTARPPSRITLARNWVRQALVNRRSWALAAGLALLVAGGWGWRGGRELVEPWFVPGSAARQVDGLQRFFADCGPWAPLAYVGLVVAEVVIAPLPGLMLYAPGGLVFGPWAGGALSLVGNVLGAGLACALTRRLGTKWLERWMDTTQVERIQAELERRGGTLIFWLRLNPLTSCDLLSYAAGFTRISMARVMLATGAGMAPLCFAQSHLSNGLLRSFPQLIYPLLAASAIYVIVLCRVVRHALAVSALGRPASLARPQSGKSEAKIEGP